MKQDSIIWKYNNYTTSTKYPQGSYKAYVYFQHGSVLLYSGLVDN